MKYWFDGDDAQRYGLPAAAVLAHLRYWIERNDHETGRPCVTQTVEQMGYYIPFLSEKQIRRALGRLVQADAITRERNGFNPVYTYCLKGTIGVPKRETAIAQKGEQELPKRETVHILNNKTKEKAHAREDFIFERPTEDQVIEYLIDRGAKDLAHTLGPHFFNYYEANGWMVNGTPIHKWKPKLNQWLTNERNRQSNDRRKGFNAANFTPEGLRDFIDNG